jgi:hypothetical protein
LQEANCEVCRRITSKIDEVVTREMYWPLRLRLVTTQAYTDVNDAMKRAAVELVS